MNFYQYCESNHLNRVDWLGYWAQGDGEYSLVVQLQLIGLTHYYDNPGNTGHTKASIAQLAQNIRNNNSQNTNNAKLAISVELDNAMNKGTLSNAKLQEILNKYGVTFSSSKLIMNTSLKNTNLVNIVSGNNQYAGGDQAWLTAEVNTRTEYFQSKGCGAIAATNILAYYALKNDLNNILSGVDGKVAQWKYLNLANMIAKDYVYPGPHGVTDGVFDSGIQRLFKAYGLNISTTVYKNKNITTQDALGYLANALMLDDPVALVNYKNDGVMLKRPGDDQRMEYHWVTATELQINILDITQSNMKVSSWGNIFNLNFYDSWNRGTNNSVPGILGDTVMVVPNDGKLR